MSGGANNDANNKANISTTMGTENGNADNTATSSTSTAASTTLSNAALRANPFDNFSVAMDTERELIVSFIFLFYQRMQNIYYIVHIVWQMKMCLLDQSRDLQARGPRLFIQQAPQLAPPLMQTAKATIAMSVACRRFSNPEAYLHIYSVL